MTFSQHRLQLLSKESYVKGGSGSGKSSTDLRSNSSVRGEKPEKKYGLITREDRYSSANNWAGVVELSNYCIHI